MLPEDTRQKYIESFLDLKTKLKEQTSFFDENLDEENEKSKIYGLIDFLSKSNIIDDEKKNEIIKQVQENSYEAKATISLIEEQIDHSLKGLGYTGEIKKTQEEVNENDLVKKYDDIIKSIEKMISELDKNMKEVDNWINDISKSINYNYEKEVEQNIEVDNTTEIKQSTEIEEHTTLTR